MIKVTLEFASYEEATAALAAVMQAKQGKPAAALAGAAGQATAPAGAVPGKTGKDKSPIAASAASQPQGSTAATGEGKPAAGSSEQEAPAASGASSSEAVESQLSYEVVGKAITTYAAKHGRDATLAKLGEFGVKSGKELKPEQYAAALDSFGG